MSDCSAKLTALEWESRSCCNKMLTLYLVRLYPQGNWLELCEFRPDSVSVNHTNHDSFFSWLQALQRMSSSLSTTYFTPAGVSMLSPAYLKYRILSPSLTCRSRAGTVHKLSLHVQKSRPPVPPICDTYPGASTLLFKTAMSLLCLEFGLGVVPGDVAPKSCVSACLSVTVWRWQTDNPMLQACCPQGYSS